MKNQNEKNLAFDKRAIAISAAIGRGDLIAKNSNTQYSRFSSDYRGVNNSQIPVDSNSLDENDDTGD